MARELKKYHIRATPRPIAKRLLASTVLVIDENGEAGYCYITFSDALVEAVGRKLVWGVSDAKPAFLVAEYCRVRKEWMIGARYLGQQRTGSNFAPVLWSSVERPAWLKRIFRNEVANGSDTEITISTARRKRRTGASSTGSGEQAGAASRITAPGAG